MAGQAVQRPQALACKVAHKSRTLLRAVSEDPVRWLKLSHAPADKEKKTKQKTSLRHDGVRGKALEASNYYHPWPSWGLDYYWNCCV